VEVVLFIVWIAIAIACASIMKGKGRSEMGGFLLGLFFSVIGLLICAFLPSLRQDYVVMLTPEQAAARELEKSSAQAAIKSERVRVAIVIAVVVIGLAAIGHFAE